MSEFGLGVDTIRTADGIALLVDGEVEGDGGVVARGIEAIDHAGEGDLTFIGDARHAKHWATSSASIAMATRGIDLGDWSTNGRAVIRVANADQAMILVLEFVEAATADLLERPTAGINAGACVDPTATIEEDAVIGPFAVIGARCRIGSGTIVESGVRIYPDATIGANVHLHSGVIIRERCVVGDRSILHAGVVIGSDGFGYRPDPGGVGLRKIPHVGHVEIGADVEIGANSCIDRGKFGATIIGQGSKIDNLCQIGHNVKIGKYVVISGLTGIAGSTTVGDGTLIGGGVGLSDHIRIGVGCQIAGRSGVMNDIPDGEAWAGMPAKDARDAMKEWAVIRRLPEWSKRLRGLLEPR
ncbi:MAG: UDP-3-O-(3-hydroxymyristoyl)glucosamine N-acyltransferase [Planctomycetota bacterium]|nr:UDP-3-O-(3-hydroxymyristoyl)glucosamine N-acyltransferase [Planctomycetota bacterium]MDA1025979.1 UDP-3-O-(3-hydroxymyristoyl)glucosamine N-acyltransferase [Planctomycetota bacterium]